VTALAQRDRGRGSRVVVRRVWCVVPVLVLVLVLVPVPVPVRRPLLLLRIARPRVGRELHNVGNSGNLMGAGEQPVWIPRYPGTLGPVHAARN